MNTATLAGVSAFSNEVALPPIAHERAPLHFLEKQKTLPEACGHKMAALDRAACCRVADDDDDEPWESNEAWCATDELIVVKQSVGGDVSCQKLYVTSH